MTKYKVDASTKVNGKMCQQDVSGGGISHRGVAAVDTVGERGQDKSAGRGSKARATLPQ